MLKIAVLFLILFLVNMDEIIGDQRDVIRLLKTENQLVPSNIFYCHDKCEDTKRSAIFSIEACHCDFSCHDFNDCCHNVEKISTNRIGEKYGSCVQLVDGSLDVHMYSRMITSCPETLNTKLKHACENPTLNDSLTFIPVYERKRQLNYRNIFCAMCHDVYENDVTFWKAYLETVCAKLFYNESLNNVLSFSPSCLPRFYLREIKYDYIQPCLFDVIKTCPQHSPKHLINACEHSDYYVVSSSAKLNQNTSQRNQIMFKNKFCAACHNISSDELQCGGKLIKDRIMDHKIMLPLSSLSDFTVSIEELEYFRSAKNDVKITVQFYSGIVGYGITTISIFLYNYIMIRFKLLRAPQSTQLRQITILTLFLFLSSLGYFLIILQGSIDYSYKTCYFIAIFTYFSHMCTFIWTFCIAKVLRNVITKNYLASNLSIHLIRNFLMSLSSSFVLVVIAVLVDIYAGRGDIAPRFANKVCWFNCTLGHVLFYFIPFAVVFLMNLFIFINIVAHLRQSASTQRQLICHHNGSVSASTILKIAIIIGMPNVLAFINILIPKKSILLKHMFDVIISLSSGLQGTFLVLSILWSENIVKLFKN